MHKIYITLTLVAGLLLGLGLQQHKIQGLEHEILEFKLAEARAKEIIIREREADALYIQTLREAHVQEQEQLESLLASVSDDRTRLIDRMQQLKRTQTCTNQATEVTDRSESERNQATFDLFIQLFDRHTRELEEVGRYADELRTHGLRCEQYIDRVSE